MPAVNGTRSSARSGVRGIPSGGINKAAESLLYFVRASTRRSSTIMAAAKMTVGAVEYQEVAAYCSIGLSWKPIPLSRPAVRQNVLLYQRHSPWPRVGKSDQERV